MARERVRNALLAVTFAWLWCALAVAASFSNKLAGPLVSFSDALCKLWCIAWCWAAGWAASTCLVLRPHSNTKTKRSSILEHGCCPIIQGRTTKSRDRVKQEKAKAKDGQSRIRCRITRCARTAGAKDGSFAVSVKGCCSPNKSPPLSLKIDSPQPHFLPNAPPPQRKTHRRAGRKRGGLGLGHGPMRRGAGSPWRIAK